MHVKWGDHVNVNILVKIIFHRELNHPTCNRTTKPPKIIVNLHFIKGA